MFDTLRSKEVFLQHTGSPEAQLKAFFNWSRQSTLGQVSWMLDELNASADGKDLIERACLDDRISATLLQATLWMRDPPHWVMDLAVNRVIPEGVPEQWQRYQGLDQSSTPQSVLCMMNKDITWAAYVHRFVRQHPLRLCHWMRFTETYKVADCKIIKRHIELTEHLHPEEAAVTKMILTPHVYDKIAQRIPQWDQLLGVVS